MNAKITIHRSLVEVVFFLFYFNCLISSQNTFLCLFLHTYQLFFPSRTFLSTNPLFLLLSRFLFYPPTPFSFYLPSFLPTQQHFSLHTFFHSYLLTFMSTYSFFFLPTQLSPYMPFFPSYLPIFPCLPLFPLLLSFLLTYFPTHPLSFLLNPLSFLLTHLRSLRRNSTQLMTGTKGSVLGGSLAGKEGCV